MIFKAVSNTTGNPPTLQISEERDTSGNPIIGESHVAFSIQCEEARYYKAAFESVEVMRVTFGPETDGSHEWPWSPRDVGEALEVIVLEIPGRRPLAFPEARLYVMNDRGDTVDKLRCTSVLAHLRYFREKLAAPTAKASAAA